MSLTVTHTHGRDVAVRAGEVEIARYVYEPYPAPFESPKPYLHPLRNLAGDVVTIFRPHDHLWHKGLQLTATDVSGTNLWGGNTYVDGEGYVVRDNLGTMRPDAVPLVEAGTGEAGAGEVVLEQPLTWIDAADVPLVSEQRVLRFHALDRARQSWALDLATAVTNVRDHPLTFGSPHTNGMTGSGYTGLWWRGPRSFTDGTLLTAEGPAPETDLRGRSAEWVAYVGQHDEVERSSTLAFAHAPENDLDAAHWFVRTGDFAGVNPSWAFHRTFDLAPGESFRRRYRVVVAVGSYTAGEVDELLKGIPW